MLRRLQMLKVSILLLMCALLLGRYGEDADAGRILESAVCYGRWHVPEGGLIC